MNEFKICFNEMNELESAVCMYWDLDDQKWSTEGIRMNDESKKKT